jgi:Tfp pilus assembly protein PilF
MANIPFRNFFAGIKRRFSSLTGHAKTIVVILILTLLGAAAAFVYVQYIRNTAPANNDKQEKAEVQKTTNTINSGNYKSALSQSQALVEKLPADSPQRYDALVNLGISYTANGQIDKALETLQQAEAIKKDQTSYSVFVMMAQLYTKKGDKAKAIDYYNKTIARAKATPEDSDDLYIPTYQSFIKELQK